MKKSILLLFIAVFLQTVLFAEAPKREVRAVWLTTAWGLDWPSVSVPAPVFAPDGVTITNEAERATARTQQQNELLTLIDRIETANFNTIYFQVRPMSDAFYRSNIPGEAWSQWLSSCENGEPIRGVYPGWSPLEFLIEHAHARGMEVHAWLNPFRYSTSIYTHGMLPTDYAVTHPEWILDYGFHPNGLHRHQILNPGIPEVRQHIADIVEDIISNYNVDGIVFDDYFYIQRWITQLTLEQFEAIDNAQFLAYNPHGLSLHDWRRENVNQMVAVVQERILAVAPWIQFGMSPAGVASSDPNVAAGHGVRPSPGNDWQYTQIFSDPVMWLRRGIIDYISPQIYWSIISDHPADYSRVAAWWSEVSNQFGRHLFTSNTALVLVELEEQVTINRKEDLNNAPGFVLFRANQYDGDWPLSQWIYDDLRRTVFQHPALPASFGWKYAPIQGLVENLNLSGQNLTWTYTSTDVRVGVRYAVYAVPNADAGNADIFTSNRLLQGISYTTNFTLPAGVSPATHKIAVAVFDRFGNLFPPRTLGGTLTTIAPAQLTFPANNQTNVPLSTLFTWEDNGAHKFVWQLAYDADFTNPIASREVTSPNFNIGLQGNIRPNTYYYWRVLSIKADAPVSISEVRRFNGTQRQFNILSPQNGTQNVSARPTITWNSVGEGAVYTLELSEYSDFRNIAYTAATQTTTITTSVFLNVRTTYFARVRAALDTEVFFSNRIHFTTDGVPVPAIISPADSDVIHGSDIVVVWAEQPARRFRVQLSQNPNFPPANMTSRTVAADVFTTTFTGLAAGTWHIRLQAEGVTDAGSVVWIPAAASAPRVTVQLTGQDVSAPEVETSEFVSLHHVSDGLVELVINQTENTTAFIEVFSLTGALLDRQIRSLDVGQTRLHLDMTNYARGIYLIRVTAGSNSKTLRTHR